MLIYSEAVKVSVRKWFLWSIYFKQFVSINCLKALSIIILLKQALHIYIVYVIYSNWQYFCLWLICCVCVGIYVGIAQVQEKRFATVCAGGFEIHFESQKKIPEYLHCLCNMLALVSLSDSSCSSKCILHTTPFNKTLLQFTHIVFTSFPKNVIGKMQLWCLIMQLKLEDLNRPAICVSLRSPKYRHQLCPKNMWALI